MTYNDIYTKFIIGYDKANITSSYPSLTDYEIATLLDKAYLAIIAQKLTGNNQRRSTFESDIKAIEDLRPLVITDSDLIDVTPQTALRASNEYVYSLPENFLYYVQSYIKIQSAIASTDELDHIRLNTQLVDHRTANAFKCTPTNQPWVKTPVCYIEGSCIYYVIDPFDKPLDPDPAEDRSEAVTLTYIKQPLKFTEQLPHLTAKFQLSDTMAEELINLAIVFATENVESPRLQTKLTTKALES